MTPPTTTAHPSGGLGWLVGRPWFWALLVGVLFAAPLARSLMRRLPPTAPVLGELPAAATTAYAAGESAGAPFALSELAGKVWIATLVDPADAACDRLAATLTTLQRRARNLGDDFRIVSFVPPAVDRRVLADFAAAHHPNPRRWLFVAVTGPIETALGQAMERAGVVPPVAAATTAGQVHGKHLAALVDRHGRVRGFYDVLTPSGLDAALADLGLVANLDR